MGYGDEVMATGLVKGAAARGKCIGFGDGQRLIWGPHFEEVFRYNPNVARIASAHNIEWSNYGKGKRPTFVKTEKHRYIWNYDFKVVPGEFFFNDIERKFSVYKGGILIEPNVMWFKSWAINKDWGFEKYQTLCDRLLGMGHAVWQTSFGSKRLKGARIIAVPNFRSMAASLSGFDLIVCPEGGMSHAAAAVSVKAVVIFGGFPAVRVVGYDFHKNLTAGSDGCGSIEKCQHCLDAMKRISVDEVIASVDQLI